MRSGDRGNYVNHFSHSTRLQRKHCSIESTSGLMADVKGADCAAPRRLFGNGDTSCYLDASKQVLCRGPDASKYCVEDPRPCQGRGIV